MDDFRLVASWVAEAMGGTLTGDGAREFSGVSIDTRTLEAGELFVLPGKGTKIAWRTRRFAPGLIWRQIERATSRRA